MGQSWTMPQNLKVESLNKTDPTNRTGCYNSTFGFIVTNTHNRLAAEHSFEARQLAANQTQVVIKALETGSSAVKIIATLFSAAIMACALVF